MSVFPDVDLTELPKKFEAQVPEDYIDVMGHMNVAWYIHYFSQAMLGLYNQLGSSETDINNRQIGRFALESHIRYFREVRLGHQIEVYSRFIARNEKRYHVMDFMWNKSRNEISASLELVGMSIDLRDRRPASIPEDMAVQIDGMIAEHKKLDWEPPLCGVMGPR